MGVMTVLLMAFIIGNWNSRRKGNNFKTCMNEIQTIAEKIISKYSYPIHFSICKVGIFAKYDLCREIVK